MTPGEQRALLKIERSLSKDPTVEEALVTFTRRRARGGGPKAEPMSAWHPLWWRAVPLILYGIIVATVAIAVTLALV